MKSKAKSILATVVALGLTATTLSPLSTFAASSPVSNSLIPNETLTDIYRYAYESERYLANNNTTTKNYYGNQLNEIEYPIYRGLVQNIRANNSSPFMIKLPVPMVFTFPWGDTNLNNKAHLQDLNEKAMLVSQPAIDAYTRDYPESFWLDVTQIGVALDAKVLPESSPGNVKVLISGYQFITDNNGQVASGKAQRENNAVQYEINRIAGKAQQAGTSRSAQLRVIHDEIAATITYSNLTSLREFEVNGALLDHLAVCEGYAKSFKLVCEQLGIPCVIVSGTGTTPQGIRQPHMWNYVKLEDGQWYAVDVTWDDTGNDSLMYFLVGANTPDTSGRAFSVTHQANGDVSGNGIKTFGYPQLSPTKYQGSTNTTYVTSQDLVKVNHGKELSVQGGIQAVQTGQKSSSGSILANVTGVSSVPLATMQAMAKQAGTAGVRLEADTLTADGKSVDVRVTINLTEASSNLQVGASTQSTEAEKVRKYFTTYFSNKVVVVAFDQQGDFGQTVTVAVKVDPSQISTGNLVIYHYNPTTNTYVTSPIQNYTVDKSGYIYFTTTIGDSIVLSEGNLVSK